MTTDPTDTGRKILGMIELTTKTEIRISGEVPRVKFWYWLIRHIVEHALKTVRKSQRRAA